jgi:hypothetical protein
MALSNAEKQAAWIARRNKLARTAEQLQAHDAALFKKLERTAEKIWMKKRQNRKAKNA